MNIPQNSCSRLLNLLHRGEQLTYEQARQHLGLSMRHIQRLFSDLQKYGTPLKQKSKKPVVWYIAEEDREVGIHLHLSDQEAFALSVAVESARGTLAPTPLGTHLNTVFEKLLREFSTEVFTFEPEELTTHWHFSEGNSVAFDADMFLQLTRAIDNCQRIELDYYTASKNKWSYNRPVEPYGLAVLKGSWILVGYCREKRAMREFALGGISRLQETQEYFVRPEEFRLSTYFGNRFGAVGDKNTFTVRLLVEHDKIVFFERKRYHHTQRLEKRENGQVIVSYTVEGLKEIRSFVQGWGTGVTVLAPPELVELIRQEAEKIAERYKVIV
jgi:predicted DNA-binding transcriptional regulator YafY